MLVTALLLLALSSCRGQSDSQDTFNYDETIGNSYGPAEWGKVNCLDVKTCPGWPTNWGDITSFIPYDSTINNMCKDCSESTEDDCKKHVQSPIALVKSANRVRTCSDDHLMRYWAGECSYSDSIFEIMPHTLRVYRPHKPCGAPGTVQPQMDFSQGFPVPWIYKFTDISVPAQHTIEGKPFDAEIIMSHTFTADVDEKHVGNLSILLESVPGAERYDFLDLHIQGWAEVQKNAIAKCFPNKNGRRLVAELESELAATFDGNVTATSRKLNHEDTPLHDPHFQKLTFKPTMCNFQPPFTNRACHPYDWYIKANTEYYYQYEGTTVEPPCIEGVHWRVLKDPIEVNAAQIQQLNQLMKNRLDPETCLYHTDARMPGNRPMANRPLQTTTQKHRLAFCECNDWESKSKQDAEYCKLSNKERGVVNCIGPFCGK